MQSAPLDHRDLVAAYDLGHIESHSPGLIHWHPAGVSVLRKLEHWVRVLHARQGYQEVRSPALLSRELWEQSGHWDKYRELMFSCEPPGEQAYAIKPMSCPGHIGIYAHRRRSYRELPLRLFEFGHVHRREPSGALSGWMRLRGFVQDDSHVFCAAQDIQVVIAKFVGMVEQAYRAFGFQSWSWRISLRPEQRAGDDVLWDAAEGALRQACAELGIVVEEAPGEGAFYGPKLEAALVDRLGRAWQCGVAQVDFVLPERFALDYQAADGLRAQPVMIHHAVLGSLERWLSIVMEHAGALPDWLSPHAVAVLPISQGQAEAAHALCEQMRGRGIEAQVLEEGPLSGRIRDAAAACFSHIGVIGGREAEAGQVSVRGSDGKSQVMAQSAWIEALAEACAPPAISGP